MQAPSKRALRMPLKGRMLEMLQRTREKQYQGHPQGKRPDALLLLLLWRVAQPIRDEVVKTAPHPGKQVLLNLRAVGKAAKTSTDVRATRCFVVPADDNRVKWTWAAESQPELRELGRASRATRVLTAFSIAPEEDTVPTSKQAKRVSKLQICKYHEHGTLRRSPAFRPCDGEC